MREGAPHDENHSYCGEQCRETALGEPKKKRKLRGVNIEARRLFCERVSELLQLGLSHRQVVDQLNLEGMKTGTGRTPTARTIENTVARMKGAKRRK